MKSMGSREKTIYDASLTRIFLWAGFPVFVIMLIVCMLIGALIFFYRRSDPEGIKIILFCLALVVPASYGMPLISLIKVWRQEHRLGICWKDRTDHDRPKWERDWYLDYDRGGFILCHRNYIKCLTGYREEMESGEHARRKVYYVLYEDIDGKKHKLKFSYESWAREFQMWFEKQAYKEENRLASRHGS